ncbi:MAG TPA: hypothetical protein VI389_03775, partial [Geobacteraceae bacterium]
FGQVGLDPTNSSNVTVTTPRPVAGLTGVVGLSIGADHSIAFMNNSTVRAWGYNGFGQLGATAPNNLTYSVAPLKVGTMSGITAVSAGGDHNLALQNNGTVWAWGSNAAGQIGAGPFFTAATTGTSPAVPKQVLDATTGAPMVGVTAIAAGGSHSLALKSDGTLWAWGDNTYGQLGYVTAPQTYSSEPRQVQNVENGAIVPVKAIAAGGAFDLALDGQGRVWAWGYNGLGQLGVDPLTTPTLARVTPQLVGGMNGTVTAIAAGLDHALAVVGNTLLAWGYNNFGQLGNNTTSTMSFTPVTVGNSSGTPFSVQQIIAAVGHHNIVRATDGHVYAWGDNGYGQIGDGTTINRSVPMLVSGF